MENKQTPEEESVLNLIQQIRDGGVNPRNLSREERQQCVNALDLQGYSQATIAQIFKRSDKTISRDLDEIAKSFALKPSRDFCFVMIGGIVRKAKAAQSRLLAIARNSECTAMERLQAERFYWLVEIELFEKLQSAGYLPLKPKELVLSQENKEADIEEVDQVLSEIEKLGEQDPELMKDLQEEIGAIRAKRDVVRLNLDAQKLLDEKKNLSNQKENKNEHGE